MAPRLLLEALVLVYVHCSASLGIRWKPEPEECRARVSSRDCGAPPRPLFTYVRAAARCELVMWRGCPPTGPGNIFFSEFECIRSCTLVVHPHTYPQRAKLSAATASASTVTVSSETPAENITADSADATTETGDTDSTDSLADSGGLNENGGGGSAEGVKKAEGGRRS